MSTKTKYKFKNFAKRSTHKVGKYQYYDWVVLLDQPEDLSNVKEVEYRLHETFPNPVRVTNDRDNRFRLDSSGWGDFTIFITIYLENGEEVETSHYLRLKNPWPDGFK